VTVPFCGPLPCGDSARSGRPRRLEILGSPQQSLSVAAIASAIYRHQSN
jgi:hypothetical protein